MTIMGIYTAKIVLPRGFFQQCCSGTSRMLQSAPQYLKHGKTRTLYQGETRRRKQAKEKTSKTRRISLPFEGLFERALPGFCTHILIILCTSHWFSIVFLSRKEQFPKPQRDKDRTCRHTSLPGLEPHQEKSKKREDRSRSRDARWDEIRKPHNFLV